MAWFRVDDNFGEHRKVRQLGRHRLAAIGLWQLCGVWCAFNSDGFVPLEVVRRHDPRQRLAALLVQVGLWEPAEEDGEKGYQYHDWLDYQPSKAEVLERRRKRQEAGRRGGLRSAQTRRANAAKPEANASADAVPDAAADAAAKSNPGPARPVGGYVGGISAVGSGAGERPPNRCPRHKDDQIPPPCGACADARRAGEAWDREQAELALQRRDTVRACEHCDIEGWRFEPGQRIPMTPYVRCDHTPSAKTA